MIEQELTAYRLEVQPASSSGKPGDQVAEPHSGLLLDRIDIRLETSASAGERSRFPQNVEINQLTTFLAARRK